jgi:hypothetical protein
MSNKTLIRFVLAVVCCAVIVLTPAARAYAQIGGAIQHGVEKGVDATKQGAEKAYDTTKEGAQDVKKAITGEDNNSNDRYKSSEQQSTTPTTTTRQSGTSKEGAMSTEKGKSHRMAENGKSNLPKTAGELPLLLVISLACFALVGRSKLARKKS